MLHRFLLACTLIGLMTSGPRSLEAQAFVRGDFNQDASILIDDAIGLLSFHFVPGSSQPPCEQAADVNDDGTLNIADAVYLLSFLFIPGSSPPPAPFPDCDWDVTFDLLSCDSSWCGYGPAGDTVVILDAPGQFGAGDNSVLVVDGDAILPAIPPGPGNDGFQALASSCSLVSIYQSSVSLGVNRILTFDAGFTDLFLIDDTPITDGTVSALGQSTDGWTLAVVASPTAPLTRVYRIDPFSGVSTLAWSSDEALEVVGLAELFGELLLVTRDGVAGTLLSLVPPASSVALRSDLVAPAAIGIAPFLDGVVIAQAPPGEVAFVEHCDPDGLTLGVQLTDRVDPTISGVSSSILTGKTYLALLETGEILLADPDLPFEAWLGPGDGIDHPLGVVVPACGIPATSGG